MSSLSESGADIGKTKARHEKLMGDVYLHTLAWPKTVYWLKVLVGCAVYRLSKVTRGCWLPVALCVLLYL